MSVLLPGFACEYIYLNIYFCVCFGQPVQTTHWQSWWKPRAVQIIQVLDGEGDRLFKRPTKGPWSADHGEANPISASSVCQTTLSMTGELTSRCGAEMRPPRLSQHQHLLHPSKTDEIEVLESGGIGDEPHEKVFIICAICNWKISWRFGSRLHSGCLCMAGPVEVPIFKN